MPLFLLIDIPKFNLDRRNSNPPTPSSPAFNVSASSASKTDGQQTMSPEAQTAELPPTPGSEERRASFAAKQRSSSTGSRSSSRSTSFHLPDEYRVPLRRKNPEGGEAVDGDDDELDPEGRSLCISALCGRSIHIKPKALFLLYPQSWMYTGAFWASRFLAERAGTATMSRPFTLLRTRAKERC